MLAVGGGYRGNAGGGSGYLANNICNSSDFLELLISVLAAGNASTLTGKVGKVVGLAGPGQDDK